VGINGDNDHAPNDWRDDANHIPTKYGFEVDKGGAGENDLVALKLRVDTGGQPFPAGFRLTWQSGSTGRVSLWKSANKGAGQRAGSGAAGELPLTVAQIQQEFATLYVEGVAVSSTLTDRIKISLEANASSLGGLAGGKDTVNATVTPVLEKFDIAAGLGASRLARGTRTGEYRFVSDPVGGIGFKYTAQAYKKGLSGELELVQLVRNANYLNLTAAQQQTVAETRFDQAVPAGLGALRNQATKMIYNFAPGHGGLGALDSQLSFGGGGDAPFYRLNRNYGEADERGTLTDDDTPVIRLGAGGVLPAASCLPDPGKQTPIDVGYRFQTYVVWRFADGSALFLARRKFDLRFEGTIAGQAPQNGRPIVTFQAGAQHKNTVGDLESTSSVPEIVNPPLANDLMAHFREVQ